ncbi:MAG: Lrp/AsnC family transcriptional regulator [Chloroflexi bacterium]|nr:Lrp/AsnC family transcriptional regulator [Chloroflexota bacterium]
MPRQPAPRSSTAGAADDRPAAPVALDPTDRRLLALLSEDGRRSYAELAQAVGLSAPSVYARVKKLEDRGVIQQYTIATSPELLGYGIAALVAVRQLPGFHWERLESAFHRLTAVEACYSVTGDDSYVLLVRVADARSLEDLLREIGCVEGVSSTRTMLILSTTFERKRIE